MMWHYFTFHFRWVRTKEIQETAAMTQQNTTHDKAANPKSSKYMQPQIKVDG
jgi:hypothetical protein